MSGQKGRQARCFRCVYVWRVRRAERPKVCPRCKSALYAVPKIRPIVLGKGLGIEQVLGPHRGTILRVARDHGARNVRVFGSVRRGTARESSDVDLLVDWVRGSNRVHLATALENLIGRRVDIASPDQLWWAAAPSILAEAVPL
jgi:predicted nucleotidyltransferase